MPTFTVTNLLDTGVGSLREAIVNAASGDTINFHSDLQYGTIALSSGELSINKSLTIEGLGANFLTISGGNNGFRVLNIDDGTDALLNVIIKGLTITGGNLAGNGSGLRNRENLTIQNSLITGNKILGQPGIYEDFDGGGLESRDGNLNIINSVISDNQIIGQPEDDDDTDGGGVSVRDGQLRVINSIISHNQVNGSATDGGGIYSMNSEVTVINSTISGNTVQGVDLGSGGGIYNRYGNTTIADSTYHRR